jgi:hypothetical protein
MESKKVRFSLIFLAAGTHQLDSYNRVFGGIEYRWSNGRFLVFIRLLKCSPTSFANDTEEVVTFFECT